MSAAPRATGQIIEIGGARSTGRTALAYRIVLEGTLNGGITGWVDPKNRLDPSSLRRAGVDLDRVLWVRPREIAGAFRAVELLLKSGFRTVILDLCDVDPRAVARLGNAAWSRLWRAVRGARGTIGILTASPGRSPRHAPSFREDSPSRKDVSSNDSSSLGSVASLGLRTTRQVALFDRGLFEGYRATARVVRNRAGPTGREHAFHVFHRDESAFSP